MKITLEILFQGPLEAGKDRGIKVDQEEEKQVIGYCWYLQSGAVRLPFLSLCHVLQSQFPNSVRCPREEHRALFS